jgi:hypothetical protein
MTKKHHAFLPKEEFNHHKDMKNVYPSYPKLPKALVSVKRRMTTTDSFKDSVLVGFRKRVFNWTKNQKPYL